MSGPRFSIIIPTRNRPETLASSLKACVSQDYEDYEVIVCDNCGEAPTREVVGDIGGARTVYVRSDTPLAMSLNWELALSRYKGEFVIVVGDDDGLPPYALRVADELIRALDVKVLNGRSAYYMWPGLNHPHFSSESLQVPLPAPPQVRSARQLLMQSVRAPKAGSAHPSLYNSFVHRDVIEAIRAPNGRIFNSCTPDWYSGCAIVSRVDRLGISGVPLHIAGLSKRSNGYAGFSGSGNDVQREFVNLNVLQGLPWHPRVPEVTVSPSCIAAECLEQVRDHLGLDAAVAIGPKQLVRSIRADLLGWGWPIAPEAWATYAKEISRYAERHGLGDWLTTAFPEAAGPMPEWKAPKQLGYGVSATHMNLHTARFGVSDVNGAAQLMGKVLQGGSGQMPTVAEPSTLARWTSATKDLVKSRLPGDLFDTLSGLKASANELTHSLRDRARSRTGGHKSQSRQS